MAILLEDKVIELYGKIPENNYSIKEIIDENEEFKGCDTETIQKLSLS